MSSSVISWGQFYQGFTRSFYKHRSQKYKKEWQVDCIFVILWSMHVKSACKYVGEIDTWLSKEQRKLIPNFFRGESSLTTGCLNYFKIGSTDSFA